MAISRKKFLVSFLALGGLGVGINVFATDNKGAKESLKIKLSNILGDVPSAQLVGEEYLKLRPDERDAERLVTLIVPEQRAWRQYASDSSLREYFKAKVEEDFRKNHTVHLQGWLLSETELRLCALVHLANA